MNYWKLKYMGPEERKIVARNLQRLREQLRSAIPFQTVDNTLVLGTWNIRNFDDNRFGHGFRRDESLFYIAEVISAFDALAVQEITTDLVGFTRLKDVVGWDYDFILTDATEGRSGNDERLGFAFNRKKVSFRNVAGEIVLPQNLLISSKNNKLQFSRTPFCCQFQAGWFTFMFATVHVYYGSDSKKSAEYRRRVDEIQSIANFLRKRADGEGINYVLVGDFNIDEPGDHDKAFNALAEAGFEIFLNREGSNSKRTKYYDQISFRSKAGEVELAASVEGGPQAHGVYDVFKAVFRDEDFDYYDPSLREGLSGRLKAARKQLKDETSASGRKRLEKSIAELTEIRRTKANRRNYYLNEWRTFQISDHVPLWVTLKIDFTDRYLAAIN